MGAKSARLARFKELHPICFFCATSPTETLDHVPSRECFKDKIGPEGLEFPACQRCNHGASQIEQVIALYLPLANHADPKPSEAQVQRLYEGVRNNNPDLLPRLEMNSRAAREFYREKNLKLPLGQTFAETPLLELPEGYAAAFDLFARRLTCALYYREVGSPLPLDHHIAVAWLPCGDPVADEVARKAKGMFSQLNITNRRNTNIGEQFVYMWGYKAEENLFGCISQFGRSFLVLGGVVGPNLQSGGERWVLHRKDVPWV